jgi:hypothetical protein
MEATPFVASEAVAGLSWLELAQLFALLAAGLFFLIKLLQGWFIVNLSLDLQLERCSGGERGPDLVAVNVKATKGPIGSLRLGEASVRATWLDQSTAPQSLFDGSRLQLLVGGRSALSVPWVADYSRGRYRLPPGESTTWGAVLEVPSGQPVLVEVVVTGRQARWRRLPQWRAKAASLPARGNQPTI